MSDNMEELTIIAQRAITDHLRSIGGVQNLVMTKELLLSASSGRQKYHAYLDEERKKEEGKKKSEKRKAAFDEIDALKVKRKRVESIRTELVASSDEYAQKAESLGKIQLVAKSNALRRAAKDKEAEIKAIDEELSLKTQHMKSV